MTCRYELKRVALVGCVLTSCLLFTGLIFGWAPLLLMLQEEHQFAELCDGKLSCVSQENKLNLIFAIASVAANIGALPFGIFLDYYGPKVALSIGAVVEISGLVLMALADSKTFDVFVPGYTLLAFGGSITMMSSFPASFLMIEYQTVILAAISCLFDGSSVIFLVLYSIRSAYDISRQELFFALAAGATLLYSLLIFLWHLNEQALTEDSETQPPGENTTLLRGHSSFEEIDMEPTPVNGYRKRENEASHLLNHPLRDQIFTIEYTYIAVFAFVQVLRATMFIGTINKLLENYGDSKYGFLLTKVFSFVLPLGFLFVPAIDHTVERQGLNTSLIVTNGLGVLANVLQLIPILELQCFTFFVFTGFRAFLYAIMSAFIAKTFGLRTMGTLAGLMFSLSSVIGLLEYPAVTLTNSYLGGDLTVVNLICLALALMLFPLTNWYHNREQARIDKLRLSNALVESDFPVEHGIAYLRSPCRKSPLRLVLARSQSSRSVSYSST